MTEHETYVQALRALRRLRSKALIGGPYWMNGKVCAVGALRAHLKCKAAIPKITFTQAVHSQGHEPGEISIIQANDEFMEGDDSLATRRARYRHMVRWLEQRIAETAP